MERSRDFPDPVESVFTRHRSSITAEESRLHALTSGRGATLTRNYSQGLSST